MPDSPLVAALLERVRHEGQLAAGWYAERAVWERHLRALAEGLEEAREIVELWRSRPWPDETGYVDNITRLSRTDHWDERAAQLLRGAEERKGT